MKSKAAGYPTKTSLPGRAFSHSTYCGKTIAGGCGFSRQAAHASGCDRHHSIVRESALASCNVSRLAVNVPTSVLSAKYAAEPRLNIELTPGMGPSVSTSVLT